MSNSFTGLNNHLFRLSNQLLNDVSRTPYTSPEYTTISTKSILESLLSTQNPNRNTTAHLTESHFRASVENFTLACALLSASRSSTHELLSWIPNELSIAADSAFEELSRDYCGVVGEEKRLVMELMPEVVPLLKERINESSIGKGLEADEVSAASSRTPVGLAIVAAYQFRWFVTKVPYLEKLIDLVVPCVLTALDHWSPDVKGQGMISLIHLAKNVNAAELGRYEDVILDACCQNIASADEIWHLVVEMSVLLVTYIQWSNPRSPWFEKILNEMLGHLERQLRNKDRRIAWLTFIEPLLNGVGLVLLAHFRRIFPLFFKWMHADDDETVLLVLQRIHTVIRLTWIRNTPYVERLVDELVILYKEAALRVAREGIRTKALEILVLLRRCKGLQFEAALDKHRDDQDLTSLISSLSGSTMNSVASQVEQIHSNHPHLSSQPLTTM